MKNIPLEMTELTLSEEAIANPHFVLNGIILNGGELLAVKGSDVEGKGMAHLLGYVTEAHDGHGWYLENEKIYHNAYLNCPLEEGLLATFVPKKPGDYSVGEEGTYWDFVAGIGEVYQPAKIIEIDWMDIKIEYQTPEGSIKQRWLMTKSDRAQFLRQKPERRK